MFDRMSMFVSAGAVTAGVSVALLAGAGVANAVTETAAGADTSTSATSDASSGKTATERDDVGTVADARHEKQSAGSDTDTDTETEADDAKVEPDDAANADDADDADDSADASDAANAANAADDANAADANDSTNDADDSLTVESGSDDPDQAGQREPAAGADDVAEQASQRVNPFPEPEGTTSQTVADPAEDAELPAKPDAVVDVAVETATVAVDGDSAAGIAVPEAPRSKPTAAAEPVRIFERLSLLSAADAPSAAATAPRQTVLSLLGAIVFNLYSFAVRVVGGPPLLPWGSTVTVRSSKVEIDCGDGYEVPADWYVPEGPIPTQLIYLQHGFLAAGPFYSYTASRLAEATHSIVVATSLTSNFLACDGCWVGGSPMHKAVADLFDDDNTALADSAAAAGYGPSLLDAVDKIVLTGHSAGGGLAVGAAGYLAGNGTLDRLAGVVMLDGVGFGTVTPDALAKLPDELPVYNLAGKAYFWNMNGSTGAALEKEWPGKFSGVRLIGGLHSDTMLGGNPLIQAGLNLVTGWSKIENVKAAELLTADWINDMFAGSQTSPYYGPAGTILEIETARGTAQGYVAPGPPERLTLLDVVSQFFANILFGIDFATCAAPRMDNVIELPTPNTALSLDGGTKPGQSIGQQCMQG